MNKLNQTSVLHQNVSSISVSCIGLLHNPWFLIEEGGGGGMGWQLHCFLNATKCCSIVNIKSHVTVRLKSSKVILWRWKREIDSHNI